MSSSFCIEYNQCEALKLQQAKEVWNRENKIDQVKMQNNLSSAPLYKWISKT